MIIATAPKYEPVAGATVEVRLDASIKNFAGMAAIEGLIPEAGDWIATLRPQRQGGAFNDPDHDAERLGALVACGAAGATLDIEGDYETLDPICTALGLRAENAPRYFFSAHLGAPPTKDDGLLWLQKLQDTGGCMEKLGIPVSSFADHLRVMELISQHKRRGGRPAIQPIGGGTMLRAQCALAGNVATYGHAPGAPPAVDGQPSAQDLLAQLHFWGLGTTAAHNSPGVYYAVLGGDLSSSLSPKIHNFALEQTDARVRYGAIEVPNSIAAMRLIAGIGPRIGLIGANITAPLKRHAFEAVATRDDSCPGVANTWVPEGDSEFAAHNTDVAALESAFSKTTGGIAIVGAGGYASAALAAAEKLGREASVYARNPESASLSARPLDELTHAPVICNATGAEIDLPESEWTIDAGYNPDGSNRDWLTKRAGKHIGGAELLIAQAARSHVLWRPEQKLAEIQQIMQEALCL